MRYTKFTDCKEEEEDPEEVSGATIALTTIGPPVGRGVGVLSVTPTTGAACALGMERRRSEATREVTRTSHATTLHLHAAILAVIISFR